MSDYATYLNNLWIALIGMATFYFGRIYHFFIWTARVTRQDVENLVTNHRGLHIKYAEDRVDIVNPCVDSGMLFGLRWFCSYSLSDRDSARAEVINLLGGGGSSSQQSEYTITSLRFFRGKLLELMEIAKREAELKKPKLFIVGTYSPLFAGDVEERYLNIPKEIEERLNGERTTRLNILLHGTVGTGKTTIARAIACRLRQSIYILSIDAWWDLGTFIRALQRIPDRAIILFDDFEITLRQVLKAQIGSDGSIIPLKFSTSSIMAMLDGILFKNRSWIVIMCTNEPDWIKQVLRLRPGRVHLEYQCTETHMGDYTFASQNGKTVSDGPQLEKICETATSSRNILTELYSALGESIKKTEEASKK